AAASLSTERVPRKSSSPSACTEPDTSMPSEVATARIVTPAQATSACSSMSPERAFDPSPTLAGCSPALTSSRPVLTEQSHAPAELSAGPQQHQGPHPGPRDISPSAAPESIEAPGRPSCPPAGVSPRLLERRWLTRLRLASNEMQ